MDFNCTGAEEHWVQAMAREPVPRDVLFWRANHYLLPMGRAGEAVVMEARVLEGDPLNLLYRRLYATALLHAHRPADAEIELRKLVEIQEDPFTLETLGIVLATQGRFEDALAVTECAHSSLPESNIIAGQLAAFLIRAVLFHALCGEFGQAATWTERAIDERYAVLVAKIGTLMRPSPQWPALAKLMNLPA
jgi:Flp pilus assembly protein TadD